MFLADCHTHCSCSPDSSTPMAEMGRKAVEYGLTTLSLTDHCDLLSLEGERTLDYDWTPVLRQREETLAAVGTKLDLPLGIEFGMAFLFPEAADKILSQPGIDFVIGAVHNLSETAGGRDFYMLDYETPAECYEALDDYFQSMVALAAGPHYDVVAHIIYPLRYMRHRLFPLPSLTRYRDRIHEIMRLAKDSGRGIEINTWKGQTLAEWLPLLKMYKEMGGEIITVGSDAHAPDPIARGVPQAYQMMKDCGFRYVAVYHERKPEFIRLK